MLLCYPGEEDISKSSPRLSLLAPGASLFKLPSRLLRLLSLASVPFYPFPSCHAHILASPAALKKRAEKEPPIEAHPFSLGGGTITFSSFDIHCCCRRLGSTSHPPPPSQWRSMTRSQAWRLLQRRFLNYVPSSRLGFVVRAD